MIESEDENYLATKIAQHGCGGHMLWGRGESCRASAPLPLAMYNRLYWKPHLDSSLKSDGDRKIKGASRKGIDSSGTLIYRPSFDGSSDEKWQSLSCFYFSDAVLLKLTMDSNIMAYLGVLAQSSHRISVGSSDGFERIRNIGQGSSDLNMEQLLRGIISQIVISMIDERSYDSEECAAQGEILAYMMKNCTKNASVSDFAELAGMSAAHFSRCFTTHIGISPARCMRELLFVEVRSMLLCLHMQRSLLDIAMLCGFSDQPYFTRAFKSRFGMTPGVYRKLSIR